MQVATWSEAIQGFHSETGSDRVFRDALARFGTGVTVVTTKSDSGPVGLTANSFTSISLHPPLVMWAGARESRRFVHFEKAEHIAVHVLGRDQSELCWAFAKSNAAFDQADWHRSAHDIPLIDGCLARFECTKYATHEAGDHVIMILQVHNLLYRDGEPLLFFEGKTGRFDPTG